MTIGRYNLATLSSRALRSLRVGIEPTLVLSTWSCITAITFATACAGDPYARYAGLIGRDVDGTTVALGRMTNRVQRTVVGNDIPFDSLKVWWEASVTAAEAVRERSVDFADATPPPGLEAMHAQVGGTLASILAALRGEADLFSACVKEVGGADSAHIACRSNVEQRYPGLSESIATGGEDLRLARVRVQHLLSLHGVLLPESVPDSAS